MEIIKELYNKIDNIKVVSGSGAAVDIAMLHECKAIIRGLRGLSDYDYEVQLAQINKDISNNKVNTICLFADKDYQFISSSVVKEVFNLDKDISKYVDNSVKIKMLKLFYLYFFIVFIHARRVSCTSLSNVRLSASRLSGIIFEPILTGTVYTSPSSSVLSTIL